MEYYRVKVKLKDIPLDYHSYGFESENQWLGAVYERQLKYKGEVGESIEKKPARRKLRIRNIYGSYEDVWFYDFMLERTTPPIQNTETRTNQIEEELDNAFGFD